MSVKKRLMRTRAVPARRSQYLGFPSKRLPGVLRLRNTSLPELPVTTANRSHSTSRSERISCRTIFPPMRTATVTPDPNIMIPAIREGVQTDGGAFNVREGNHSENLSTACQLRSRLEPSLTLTFKFSYLEATRVGMSAIRREDTN